MMFIVSDEDDNGEGRSMYIVAPDMGTAITKWRKWIVAQSDGAMSELTILAYYPSAITTVATDGEVIL